jgi:flagellar hook assembly protein FlgD
VRLEVFDGRGAPVVTLEDGARDAGPHLVSWDGTNAKGRRVPAGVYYYRLVIPGHEQTKPIVWLR